MRTNTLDFFNQTIRIIACIFIVVRFLLFCDGYSLFKLVHRDGVGAGRHDAPFVVDVADVDVKILTLQILVALVDEKGLLHIARGLHTVAVGVHQPGAVPVRLLVAREFQLAGVQLAGPGEDVGTLRGRHRSGIAKVPAAGGGVAY